MNWHLQELWKRAIEKKDRITGADVIITYEHHEVHAGSSFHVSYSVVTANTDDHVTAILFRTPKYGGLCHIIATFTASNPAEAIVNEAPTLGAPTAGSDKVVLNRNRNSAAISSVQSLEATPTVGSVTKANATEFGNITLSAGTELEHIYMAGGDGPQAVGGVNRGTQEWILKNNTIYAFYLQNTGASANTHSISLDWYEHINK